MFERGLASLVRRSWYLLVLCPIVAGLSGFMIVQRIPSVYEATETIAVQPPTGADGMPNIQAAQALADSYAEQIHASPVLTAAAQSIGLPNTDASSLDNTVQARRLTNTALVRLSVQNTDPGIAAKLASAIVQAFVSQNTEYEAGRYTSAQDNLVGLITQLQDAQDTRNHQIDGLRAEPASPQRDAQIGRLQDEVTQLQARQTSADRSLQDLQLAAARSRTELSVIDPAVAPTVPIRPNRLLTIIMSILAGVFAAIGLAWFAEHLDDRLRDAPGVLTALQLPTLAQIPRVRSGINACNPSDLRVLTGFAQLRSNVLSALHPVADLRTPIFAIASAEAGDGKSAVAANLATALARTGRQVILVDADLAGPAQAALFNVHNELGLAALLRGQIEDARDVLQATCVENVRLLAAGTGRLEQADVSGLLLSKRLADVLEDLRRTCDALVIDTPAGPGGAEGVWLSARADAVVLVLDARRARKRTIEPALVALRAAGANVIGVTLNRARGRLAAHAGTVRGGAQQTSARAEGQTTPHIGRPRTVADPATDS